MHIIPIPPIVLTGGPCGGKTTALVRLMEVLSERGWLVIVVPEIATELKLSGIWHGDGLLDIMSFQRALMQYMKIKEDLWMQFVAQMDHKDPSKVVIICDRGLLDSKAFLQDDELFNEILTELGLNEIKARDERYKAVIHMVTAADGAEAFYTLENNKARSEGLETARLIDKQLQQAWTGHPHLRVIGNHQSFEEKVKKVIAEICNVLGEPVPLEIERKFLIERPSSDLLKGLSAVELYIQQTYLESPHEDQERVRKRGTNGFFMYTHTIKQFISSGQNIEVEKIISGDIYRRFLLSADPHRRPIEKRRSCFIDLYDTQRYYWEIDQYITPGLIVRPDQSIMELECQDINEKVQFPEGINVLDEVTGDKRYGNYQMALI